jgi:hypothetical protein
MNKSTIEPFTNARTDVSASSGDAAEHIAATGAAAAVKSEKTASVAKSFDAAERFMKGNTEALSKSGNASTAAFEKLTSAYQELAANNAKTLTTGMLALATVKSPIEFIELQQKLIHDAMHDVVRDSQNIAALTAAVFNSAFEPMMHRAEADLKRTLN